MKKRKDAKRKPLTVCLRFKEDLPEKREDALWQQFFDAVGLFDAEPEEEGQKRKKRQRESQQSAQLG